MRLHATLFLLLVLALTLGSCTKQQKSTLASKGEIDLSTWDFSHKGAIKLDGQWEFYWKEFIRPGSGQDCGLSKATYVDVPNLWSNYKLNNVQLGSYGFASYRLKVKTDGRQKIFAFKMSRIETAYTLWVDGKELFSAGQVGKDENMRPAWKPTDLTFMPDSANFEIVLHISNYNHRKGGLDHSILLGTPVQVADASFRIVGFDLFLLGVLLIMAIYHLGLFVLRMKDRSTLYFGLVCVFTALHLVANGEFLLVRIFPDFSWNWLVKINFIANYFRVTFFVLFIGVLFKEELNKYFLVVVSIIGVSLSAMVLVTPARVFSQTLIWLIIFVLISIVYMLYGLTRALINRKEGALYSIIGTVILLATAINDSLLDYGVINSITLVPFGVFIFIFFQSFMLSWRSSKSFTSVEKLTKRLLSLDKIKNEFLSVHSYELHIPLKILVENFGAERGALILKNDEAWMVEAEAFSGSIGSNVFKSLALTKKLCSGKEAFLPYPVLMRVIETQKPFVSNDAILTNELSEDDYIASRLTKSILCVPLIENGNLKGLLYLENNFVAKAFTEERLNVLDLLSSQISTLIDNAKIYKELEELNLALEDKVKERTAEVMQQKEEIMTQRDEIEESNNILNKAYEEIAVINRDITNSIRYAKRIQESILPSKSLINDLFPESFVFFKPRDILSGDFYWFDRTITPVNGVIEEIHCCAAVDCTGHGVPGALMSIIGNNLLNYALNELKLRNPGEILNAMQFGIKQKLKPSDRKNASLDGMDLSLITFNIHTNELQFAGAKNPLFLFRNGEIKIFEGDKFAIGDMIIPRSVNSPKYTTHTLNIQKGDVAYLFSDGYLDQFGGDKGRKFMRQRFQKLLSTIWDKPMDTQQEVLKETMEIWRGGNNQIDDILVIGIRF